MSKGYVCSGPGVTDKARLHVFLVSSWEAMDPKAAAYCGEDTQSEAGSAKGEACCEGQSQS